MSIRIRIALFGGGVLLYTASFFLPAIRDFQGPVRGYMCAGDSVVIPVIIISEALRGIPPITHNFFETVAVFVVALINPLFLTYLVIRLLRRAHRALRFYEISVPLMIPFCWVIFHYQNYSPREGHFLWILGMLLVLWSGWDGFAGRKNQPPVSA